MQFVSYNIQYSKGRDGKFELQRIADAVRGADVIALQEVVRNISTVPHKDLPGGLAKLLPDYHWVYGAPTDLDASERDAQGHVVNKRMQFGIMLLSKYKILSSRLFLMPRIRSYENHLQQLGMLEGVIDLPSGALRVYSAHLNHRSARMRLEEIEYFLPRLFSMPSHGAAFTGSDWNGLTEHPLSDDFVIMGDFNMKPGSPEYAALVGEIDDSYGLTMTADRLVDTWTQSGHDMHEGTTWYDEQDNWKPAGKLDYGFVTAGLASKVTKSWIDNDTVGSDHNPLFFELDL